MKNQEKGIAVAIAEDHPMMREAIKSILTKFGFNVTIAAIDGVELLDELSRSATLPDVCLLDINTPRMKGYETAGHISRQYPKVKIAALTVNTDTDCLVGMLRNGATSYLVKGSDPYEWKVAIESIVDRGYYFSDWMANSIFTHFKSN